MKRSKSIEVNDEAQVAAIQNLDFCVEKPLETLEEESEEEEIKPNDALSFHSNSFNR